MLISRRQMLNPYRIMIRCCRNHSSCLLENLAGLKRTFNLNPSNRLTKDSHRADDLEPVFAYPLNMDHGSPSPDCPTPGKVTVLVAAQHNLMGSSLVAFLRGIPGVQVIDHVDSLPKVREALHRAQPDTLVVDVDLTSVDSFEDCLDLVRDLRSQMALVKIIVLCNTLQQQKSLLTAGSSSALLKGQLGSRLRCAVLYPSSIVQEE